MQGAAALPRSLADKSLMEQMDRVPEGLGVSSPPGLLAGRRVALLHPAWHSCGTYQVVLGQIAAYRALQAEIYPIAISSDPAFIPGRDWLWRSFVQSTPELSRGPRFFGGAPLHKIISPIFLKDVLWPYLHGDQAVMRLGMSMRAEISPTCAAQRFDLVHCNHFFLMPLAHRLARAKAPILLDSHDLQARQFALINKRMPWLKPAVSYEAMLARELEAMGSADLLLHLNAQEAGEFSALLPHKRHALLYPATPPAPMGPGGEDIIIVASNNTANVESLIWFLREVAPKIPDVRVTIAGNVDAGLRAQAPEEFSRYRQWFTGRVDDPGRIYACARLVLLPTISGHGLSIKTIEAFSSGLPIVATSLALRGLGAEAHMLDGVRVADAADGFARAIRDVLQDKPRDPEAREKSAARDYYNRHFSQKAYESHLAELIFSLIQND
ncbi:MAG: glycosyltransferase family 4 protein [Methylocystis sp.]